jgi:hypothetical protein
MIQRYGFELQYYFCDPKCDPIIDKDNGDYVLYTDHLAALAEKDREIIDLKAELKE